jgi:hypothetical protein
MTTLQWPWDLLAQKLTSASGLSPTCPLVWNGQRLRDQHCVTWFNPRCPPKYIGNSGLTPDTIQFVKLFEQRHRLCIVSPTACPQVVSVAIPQSILCIQNPMVDHHVPFEHHHNWNHLGIDNPSEETRNHVKLVIYYVHTYHIASCHVSIHHYIHSL